MPINKYVGLNRASISYDYLHTNSTTHEFLFGAIVELVDNARDAGAKKMEIDCLQSDQFTGGHLLAFLDDGNGMNRQESIGVMTFGYSAKRLDPSTIGQYGNGLKSGAMRMAKDFILFTKRSGILTCVFLSRTFHQDERLQEVIVPVPSFTLDEKPLVEDLDDLKKHEQEMAIILQYSPFKNELEFFKQFAKIDSESGTLVVCFNLRLLENGDSELDFSSAPDDISLTNTVVRDDSEVPEKESLRAYLSIVYVNPRMKVYIKGKKVATRRITSCLYKPRQYKYLGKSFKARAAKELEGIRHDVITAKEKVQLTKSELAAFQQRHMSNYNIDLVLRANFRQLQNAVQVALKQQVDAETRCKSAEKAKNDPKPLTCTFGMNLERRGHCGCMIYNNGRLIRMYEAVGPQKSGGIKCLGVICVVDVPYATLEPTHNKQSFADNKEYLSLLRALGGLMEQYWNHINLPLMAGNLSKFWENYGYRSNDWMAAPDNDDQFVLRRKMSTKMSVQCDLCLKWRILNFHKKYLTDPIGDRWNCSMHTNSTYKKCEASEELEKIPEGKVTKVMGQDDDEELELEDRMTKTALLGKDRKELARFEQTAIKSSKDAGKIEAKMPSTTVNRRTTLDSPSPEPPPSRRTSKRKYSSPSPGPRAKTKAELRRREEEIRRRKAEAEEAEKRRQQSERLQRKVQQRNRSMCIRKTPKLSASMAHKAQTWEEEQHFDDDGDASSNRSASSHSQIVSTTSVSNNVRSSRRDPQPSSTTNEDKRSRLNVNTAGADSTCKLENEQVYQQLDKAAQIIRKLYLFLLPPRYKLDKESINNMNPDELIKVDVDSFQCAYELGLRDMITYHRELAKNANSKLTALRRNVALLLDKIDNDNSHVSFQNLDVNSSEIDHLLEKFILKSQ